MFLSKIKGIIGLLRMKLYFHWILNICTTNCDEFSRDAFFFKDASFITFWLDTHFLKALLSYFVNLKILDYVRVMDMGLLELTITAVKSDSDGEQVSY